MKRDGVVTKPVMAGLDPAIYEQRHADARLKAGHDGVGCRAEKRSEFRHCLRCRWRIALCLSALLLVIWTARPAYAVRPDEMLANPVLEARAEHIGRELRCLVCRNQSIEDSEADLAHDLRLLVRRRVAAGDSDAEIIAYLRSRYGDYVLLKPPLEWRTLLLWGGPPLVLLGGAAALALFYRKRDRRDAAPLDADEERRLAAALGEAGEP